jgi:formate hydrogenlyase subunit 3/multisubunit Na+/H+ antiporter MnhD subunit
MTAAPLPAALLAAALGLPLAMLLACLSQRLRAAMPGWLALAPLPALAAALLAPGTSLSLPPLLLRLRLALDLPGAVLLGTSALLWIAAGGYARYWLRGHANAGRFAAWWLLTLAGSLGVFVAADLVSFYLLFSLVSLAAWGLVVDDGTAEARQVGMVYVALAVLGEGFLLLAFVLLAQATPQDGWAIRDCVAALPGSPARNAILALLVLGFGVKLGLVPFHFWMPLTYRTAPIPAAAVLSGAGVKAGVIGLLRFLPLGVALPGWGNALAVAGFVAAFYGVALGITRANPRTVLAFSSISQMGVIAAVLGMALSVGDAGSALPVAFYAAHHTLVKGGLFLAVGVAAARGGRTDARVLLPAAIIGIGLAGLPLTGGALAKLAIKGILGDGPAGLLGSLSSAGTAMLMIHFLLCLSAEPASGARPATPALRRLWLIMAAAAVAVPWILYGPLLGGSYADALSASALWSSAWPVLLGAALAAGLRRWGRLPRRVPDRDIALLAAGDTIRLGRAAGAAAERLDRLLRRWPVALACMLGMAVLLAAAMAGAGG